MIFLPGAWQTGRQWLSPLALDFGPRMIFLPGRGERDGNGFRLWHLALESG